MSDQPQQGYAGQAGQSSATSEYNKHWFLVRQLIRLIRTATVVYVEAVTNEGGVDAVGTVDVTPLVNMVDGLGNATEHGTISGLPYARVQGGQNAIIMDPQVGDIGVAVFADRDISAVKAVGWTEDLTRSNPGSRRSYDWADGVYLFSIMTQVPNQYIQFTDTGITIVDKNGNAILMNSTGVGIRSLNGGGVVNIIGSALQVNGVSVVVP